MNPVALIVMIVMMIAAFCVLADKKRGFGYYLLAFLFPLIGLIVALCLKKKLPDENIGTIDISESKD